MFVGQKMRPKFAAMSRGGISNRIKILISCMRLSEKFGGETIIYWPETMTCYAKFSDLFQGNFDELNKDRARKILRSKRVKYFDDDFKVFSKPKKEYNVFSGWRLILRPFENDFEKDPEGIEFGFEKVPIKLREEFLRYLRKLKPTKEIQEKIDKFMKKNNLNNFVGVHIRRGDFINSSENCCGHISSDDVFIERMEEEVRQNPETKFFLCTDSGELEKILKKRFKKRIVSFEKSSFDKMDKEFVKEGLIDLLLLSKTKLILGTYRSTFTEMAWWFGDCKAKVEIPSDTKELKRYLNRVQKKSFVQRIKEMIYMRVVPLDKRILD